MARGEAPRRSAAPGSGTAAISPSDPCTSASSSSTSRAEATRPRTVAHAAPSSQQRPPPSHWPRPSAAAAPPRRQTSFGWPRKPARPYSSAPETPPHRQRCDTPRAAGCKSATLRGSWTADRSPPLLRERRTAPEEAKSTVRERTFASGRDAV